MNPISEQDADRLNIVTTYRGDSYLTLQPGLELGGTVQKTSWHMRPYLDVYATQFIGNNRTGVNANGLDVRFNSTYQFGAHLHSGSISIFAS